MDMTSSSSVLFSLRELSRLEEERVRNLSEARAREAEAAAQAAREIEARRLHEQEERDRAERDALREVERRAREEAARIEALRHAALEAARFEAEARVRAEERAHAQHVMLEVEHARAAGGTSKPRGASWALVGVAAAAALAAGLYFAVLVPRANAAARAASAWSAEQGAAIASLTTRADAADEHARSLEADLAAARAENARLQGLLAARPLASGPRGGPGPGRGPTHGTEPHLDGFTSCPPGSRDPLCLH